MISVRMKLESGKVKRIKPVGVVAGIILVIIIIFGGFYVSRNWPLRFRSELDHFFGKGNWKVISEEKKESIMYDVMVSSRNDVASQSTIPGKFHEWNISFSNADGKQEVWQLSDHTMRINHDKYIIFSKNRYSAKQALVQELMEISFIVVGNEIRQDVVEKILPKNEADCLSVTLTYRGENPEPGFYDKLWKEPWFTVDQVSAKDYLESDLYEFYIDIFAYDYRVEKLTQKEKEHMMDSFDELEEAIRKTYGEKVKYEIYFNHEHSKEQ